LDLPLALLALALAGAGWGLLHARRAARNRRRRFEEPLSSEQRAILKARVPLSRHLSQAHRARLEGLVRLFLDEKTFVGCKGVVVNEVMKTTVAGHACLLLLGGDDLEVYPDLSTIYLHPSTYVRRDDWALDGGMTVREEGVPFDGESWDRSCVVLSLAAIREGLTEFDGLNVVLHEFAHQYDARDGESSGCPPMSGSLRSRWAPVMAAAWHRLADDERRGRETFLDPYGAESPAEFFAVLTEAFFELPHELVQEHPDLFALLVELYRLDPREWHPEGVPA